MLTLQSPVTQTNLVRPKTGRRPLQPIKSQTNIPQIEPTYRKASQIIEITNDDSNKENPGQKQTEKQNVGSVVEDPVVRIEQFEVSLADELIAIREKMERLRLDKEKTENMLKERELMMDLKMKEIEQRGEIQKVFEIEVDRLYRLNELRSLCNRILPIRSLREKEQEKIKPDKSEGEKAEEIKEEEKAKKNPCGVVDLKK
uniref:golgin subfamily A member 6-like protein 1 n=1 Tax=Erigeron canadensis TaxID=72917 RepID=UPI001CB99EE8|nr:golgin subfamily A member 6-like protein 1 [Erigeron canadensis]